MKRLIALAVINEMLLAANVLLSLMLRMKIKRKQPAPVSIKVTKMPLGDHPQAASVSAELSSIFVHLENNNTYIRKLLLSALYSMLPHWLAFWAWVLFPGIGYWSSLQTDRTHFGLAITSSPLNSPRGLGAQLPPVHAAHQWLHAQTWREHWEVCRKHHHHQWSFCVMLLNINKTKQAIDKRQKRWSWDGQF